MTAADVAFLTQLARFVVESGRRVGDDTIRVAAGDRARDPGTGTVFGAACHRWIPGVGEGAVDNRALLAALETRLVAAGGMVRAHRVDSLTDLPGDRILVTAGLGSSKLVGGIDLYPAKGRSCGCRPTRGRCPGPGMWCVPGSATGWCTWCRAGRNRGRCNAIRTDRCFGHGAAGVGVADLLADALEVMPGLGTYDLAGRESAFGRAPPTVCRWCGPSTIGDPRLRPRAQRYRVGAVDLIVLSRFLTKPERTDGHHSERRQGGAARQMLCHRYVGALGFPERGIAVAVDGEVVSRRDWSSPLIDGAEVEVLTAVQGG